MAGYWATALALLIIYGTERKHWITCQVDPVEWVNVRYFHQN